MEFDGSKKTDYERTGIWTRNVDTMKKAKTGPHQSAILLPALGTKILHVRTVSVLLNILRP